MAIVSEVSLTSEAGQQSNLLIVKNTGGDSNLNLSNIYMRIAVNNKTLNILVHSEQKDYLFS